MANPMNIINSWIEKLELKNVPTTLFRFGLFSFACYILRWMKPNVFYEIHSIPFIVDIQSRVLQYTRSLGILLSSLAQIEMFVLKLYAVWSALIWIVPSLRSRMMGKFEFVTQTLAFYVVVLSAMWWIRNLFLILVANPPLQTALDPYILFVPIAILFFWSFTNIIFPF